MRTNLRKFIALMLILSVSATVFAQRPRTETASFDIIIKGGTVYDGGGGPPRRADVGIKGDRIAAVGNLSRASSPTNLEVGQMIVDAIVQLEFALLHQLQQGN